MKQTKKQQQQTSTPEDISSRLDDRTLDPMLRYEAAMKMAEEELDRGGVNPDNVNQAISLGIAAWNICNTEFTADDDRISEANHLLARAHMRFDDFSEASRLLEEVRDHREKHLSIDDPRLGDTYGLMGTIEVMEYSLKKGEGLLKKALSIKEKYYGSNSSELCLELEGLLNIANRREDYSAARELCERMLAIQSADGEAEVGDVARTTASMASILINMDKKDEALPFAEKAILLFKEMGSPMSTDHIIALQNLANLKREQKMYTEAASLFSQAAALAVDKMNSDDYQDAMSEDAFHSMIGELKCLFALENYTEAEKLARSSITMCEEYAGYLSCYLPSSINNLAEIHRRMKKYSDAEEGMLRALKCYKDAKDDDEMALTYKSLAALYKEIGDNTKAAKMSRHAEKLRS